MQKIILILLIGFLGATAWAAPSIVYHGRLLNSSNVPVSGSVNFKIQVLSPGAEACILWEETQTQSLTSGVFSLSLNGSSSTRIDAGSHSFVEVFSNRKIFSVGAPACAPTYSSYTPGPTHARILKVSFNDGSFMGWEEAPDQAINYAPKALDSYSVGGYPASSVMRFAESSGALVNANAFDQDDYDELVNLLEGDSTKYLTSSTTEGTTLPVLAGNPATLGPGKIWYEAGEIKYYDAVSSTVKTIGSGSVSSSGNNVTSSMTIGTTTNYDLNFITNNTARMVIDSTGNVGIGTTSPAYLLDINGTARFTDIKLGSNNLTIKQDTTNPNQIQFSNHIMTPAGVLAGFGANAVSTDQVYIRGSTADSTKNALNVRNSGSATLLVARNDGNIGFGVASPQRQVHIQGSGTAGSIRLDRTGNPPTIQMHQFPDTTYGTPYQGWQFGMDGNWNFVIGDYGTAMGGGPVSTPFAVQKTTGFVGIGTTAPTGVLHVDGGTAGSSIAGANITLNAQDGGSGNTAGGNIVLAPGTASGSGTIGAVLVGSASPLPINSDSVPYHPSFQINSIDARATFSLMRYSANGNPARLIIGKSRGATVGTAGAVVGNDWNGMLAFAASDGVNQYESAGISAYADATATTGSVPTRLVFSTAGAGSTALSERVRIASDGKVGIATTSPTALLHVAGGGNTTTGKLMVLGDAANLLGFIDMMMSRGFVGYNGGTGATVIQGGGGKGLNFNVNSGTFGSGIAAVIDTTGKMGIGTTSPTALLTVNGPIVSLQNSPTIAGATPTFTSTVSFANSSAFSFDPSTAVTNDTLALTFSGTPANGANYMLSVKDAVVMKISFTATSCGTIKYKPATTTANTITTTGTGGTLITMTTIYNGANYDCYVTWASGYQ